MANCQMKKPKVLTIRVCTSSGATIGLITEELTKVIGVRVESNMYDYKPTNTEKIPIK